MEHAHNLVYQAKCPHPSCNATYVEETARRFSERIKDHNGRDHNSHIFRHSSGSNHEVVTLDNFSIISKNHRNYYNRKVSESLHIKKIKPILNAQDKSVPLKLFN